MSYQSYLCSDSACSFRFPVTDEERGRAQRCPQCGASCSPVAAYVQHTATMSFGAEASVRLSGMLDNVRSAYNVGAIMRTADGAGLHHLYLCGISPTPEHARVAKTALGSEQSVPWSYHRNAPNLAASLREQGCYLIALESGESGTPINCFHLHLSPDVKWERLVLVVGHERCGIDPDLLALCHRQVSLPMRGLKRSLNVAVAFGIAAYWLQLMSLQDEDLK